MCFFYPDRVIQETAFEFGGDVHSGIALPTSKVGVRRPPGGLHGLVAVTHGTHANGPEALSTCGGPDLPGGRRDCPQGWGRCAFSRILCCGPLLCVTALGQVARPQWNPALLKPPPPQALCLRAYLSSLAQFISALILVICSWETNPPNSGTESAAISCT